MAFCIKQTTDTVASPAISLYPVGTPFLTVLVSTGGSNGVNYRWPLLPLSDVNGVVSCPSGGDLVLSSVAEVNAMNVFKAMPEHYTAVTLIFGAAMTALAVIWGFKRVLKIFNSHAEA
jgi:hypothetical protein